MEQVPHTFTSPMPPHVVQGLLLKLQTLPARYIPEVEHFIDLLRQRHAGDDRSLSEGFFQLSAEAWDDE